MKDQPSILSHCTSGGCGAKIGPDALSGLLAGLPRAADDRLLVGFDASDDAAVYQLNGAQSLISTIDFFPPMVDNAHTFGRIAAANALSDVYAMGGTPVLALNIVCFPEALSTDMLVEMLAGGAEILAEAGVSLGGGHSVYDKEIKYGLAVTGLVDTARVLRNNTPRVGDMLLLTKPLGAGIVLAASRVGMASDNALRAALDGMQRLNKYAAEKMAAFDVSACTDVTGFGLLVHLSEMCGKAVSAKLDTSSLPVLPEALAYAGEYLLTAAGQRNRNHFGSRADVSALPPALAEILFDPQTSGGLLISVAPQQAQALLCEIQRDDPLARIIGEIIPGQAHTVAFI